MQLLSILILIQVFSGTLLLESDEADNGIQHGLLRSLVDLSESDELLDDSYISTNTPPQNSIDKLGKDFMSIPILRKYSVGNKSDEFVKYLKHIKKRCAKFFKDTAKKILNISAVKNNSEEDIKNEKVIEKEDIPRNVTLKLNNLAFKFTRKIQTYFNSLVLLKTQYDIDEDYVFLDLFETATKLLIKDFNKILDNGRVLDYSMYVEITNTINKHIKSLKIEELRYICNQYKVCIPYSILADYFERFIDEMLDLPVPEYEKNLHFLASIIVTDEDYEELVQDIPGVAEVVKKFFQAPKRAYEYIKVLKTLLIQRHKIIRVKDTKLKLRIQSFRTLMEILDGAFYCNRSDDFFKVFNETLNVVKNFKEAQKNLFAQANVINFISFILHSINLSKYPMTGVLIEAFVKGKVSNQKLYYILFQDGAKGVYM